MLVSNFFLMIFGSGSGCLGLETKHLARDIFQKSTFAEAVYVMVPESIFPNFECPWHKFARLLLPGDWLEIWWHFKAILGSHQISGHSSGRKIGGSWALVATVPGSLTSVSEILRPRVGVLRLRREYIGYMVHWKQDYKGFPAAWCPPQKGSVEFCLVGIFNVIWNHVRPSIIHWITINFIH